eukprot:jgi/Mesvir1/16484/Mv10042-RA.1
MVFLIRGPPEFGSRRAGAIPVIERMTLSTQQHYRPHGQGGIDNWRCVADLASACPCANGKPVLPLDRWRACPGLTTHIYCGPPVDIPTAPPRPARAGCCTCARADSTRAKPLPPHEQARLAAGALVQASQDHLSRLREDLDATTSELAAISSQLEEATVRKRISSHNLQVAQLAIDAATKECTFVQELASHFCPVGWTEPAAAASIQYHQRALDSSLREKAILEEEGCSLDALLALLRDRNDELSQTVARLEEKMRWMRKKSHFLGRAHRITMSAWGSQQTR